jgi:hypothetical protein
VRHLSRGAETRVTSDPSFNSACWRVEIAVDDALHARFEGIGDLAADFQDLGEREHSEAPTARSITLASATKT